MAAVEFNIWKRQHWVESKIVTIEPANCCCVQFRIDNGGMQRCPKFVWSAGWLKLIFTGVEERSHLAFDLLSGSRNWIEQIKLGPTGAGFTVVGGTVGTARISARDPPRKFLDSDRGDRDGMPAPANRLAASLKHDRADRPSSSPCHRTDRDELGFM